MEAKPFEGLQAQDEYSLTQELGKDVAKQRLEEHWSSFFQEKDVIILKAAGINTYVLFCCLYPLRALTNK